MNNTIQKKSGNAKTTICAPEDLMERAITRAQELDLTFSQYCRRLIRRDLEPDPELRARIEELETADTK